MAEEVTYLAQNVDYLGFLQTKLRDLRGIATLAYELIQNADDVRTEDGHPGATRIAFDIRDEALVVANDGIFRSRDFDRIQTIAGGGKREELETTGAFGIGFISVYQVTDAPEVYSSGRHWRIRPDAPEDRRIEERTVATQGTRFVLPWAFDATSEVRQELRLEPVDKSRLDDYAQIIGDALAWAALFLRQLTILEIARNGHQIRQLIRDPAEDDQVLIQDNEQTVIWKVLRGNFDARATELRQRYGIQIDAKRRSQVQLALSDGSLTEGRLFAVLPTETVLPLPFHINADFFPSSDRKRIIFGQDYQSEWNEAAVQAAALALADRFDELPTLLRQKRLWAMIEQMSQCRTHPVFRVFWQALAPDWHGRKIVYTSLGQWLTPTQVRYPDTEAEQAAAPILEALGLPVVHADLRSWRNLMVQHDFGIELPLLGVGDVAMALRQVGLIRPTPLAGAPLPLRSKHSWPTLWRALDELVKPRPGRMPPQKLLALLAGCAIAPGVDGRVWPAEQLARGDTISRRLFPNVTWLAEEAREFVLFADLVHDFTTDQAIESMEGLSASKIEEEWQSGKLDLAELYDWFQARKTTWFTNEALKNRLRALPIWPAGAGLRPLLGLYIPGGFDDPLLLGRLIDMNALQGRVDLLMDLGSQRLDFATYAREELPTVFVRRPDLPANERRKLVELLANQLSTLTNDKALCKQLGALPLIACDDGEFYPALQVYTRSEVRTILGRDIHVAVDINLPATQELLRLLGARPIPRPEDVIRRIRELTGVSATPDSRLEIQAVFEFLAEFWANFEIGTRQNYEPLRTMAWLPGDRGNRWYKQSEIFTTDQKYLFETQAVFLGFPPGLQRRASTAKLAEFLDLQIAPPTVLVVRHLLQCSKTSQPVNREVYRVLNDQIDNPALSALEGQPCLLVTDGRYISPDRAFWGEHPFGPYRYQLSSDWRQYDALFRRLGVREAPEAQDFVKVLCELADEYGEAKTPIDDTTLGVVLNCWQWLSNALLEERCSPGDLVELRTRRVIPNRQRMLTLPEQIFFEDRPGLAAKFGKFLEHNVIERPQGAWLGMQAVGVKFLLGQKVVEIKLAELEDETTDEALTARVAERLPILARVVEAEKAATGEVIDLTAVEPLRFTRVQRLEIQYEIRAFNRTETTPPEAVPAWCMDDEILVAYADGKAPWAAIARELAYVLKPVGEVGGLAGGLHNALEPDTLEQARQTLDLLGYPPLQQWAGLEQPVTGNPVGVGGTERPGPDAGTGGSTTPSTGQAETALTPAEALRRIMGADGEVPTPAAESPSETPTPQDPAVAGKNGQADLASHPGAGTHSPEGNQASHKGQSHGKLRTYVVPERDGVSDSPNSEAARQNSETDQAGIRRVLAYEVTHQREPHEMDHSHEGYDIESTDGNGNLRFIEVKSLSGAWGERNAAGLTKAQFETARKKTDAFWLYVVENARDNENFRIHPIQNPAQRVTQFLYDDGWEALAASEEP